MNADTRALAVFLLIGLVAGWLASFIMGGSGLVRYLLSGVIGAFVGGSVLRALGIDLGIRNALAAQIATATIGAIIVLLVARIIA